MTDRGPIQTFEVTWVNGHVETFPGHQLSWEGIAELFGGRQSKTEPSVRIHAEVDGRWSLMLQAREADIRTIRNVTAGVQLPGGGLL